MKTRILFLDAFAVAVAAGIAGAAFAPQARSQEAGGPPPMPPSSSFSARVDNPWFPLLRGTRWVYTGLKDGKRTRDLVTVTQSTKMIEGVPCVWFKTASTCGAGSKSAPPTGTARTPTATSGTSARTPPNSTHMATSPAPRAPGGQESAAPKRASTSPATPELGQTGLQEFLKGHAEDHFKIIGLFGTVAPPGKANTLLTKEWTPLEPGVIDHKMYVRGIGTVLEQSQQGPNERNELVSVTRGR